MTVTIRPMPERYRSIPARYRPGHPPIFTDCPEPSRENIELARELFKLLDEESKEWFGYGGIFADLRPVQKKQRKVKKS